MRTHHDVAHNGLKFFLKRRSFPHTPEFSKESSETLIKQNSIKVKSLLMQCDVATSGIKYAQKTIVIDQYIMKTT